jgi:preprotein translocase subunit SecG
LEGSVQTLILTLHVIVCVSLVILVLLQAGKEGMGVIFGGGGGSVFGGGGAGGMLSKLTAFMALLFILTSLSYNIVTSSRPEDKSTILDVKLEEATPMKAPAAPAVPAAPEGQKNVIDPLDQTGDKK